MSKFIIADIDLTYIHKNAGEKTCNYLANKQNYEPGNKNENKSYNNADNKAFNKVFCGLYEDNRFYEVNFSEYISNYYNTNKSFFDNASTLASNKANEIQSSVDMNYIRWDTLGKR